MNTIGRISGESSENILARALPVVQHFISKSWIEQACFRCGHVWRERCLGPALTLLACIYKQLAGGSTRQVEDWLASLSDEDLRGRRDGHTFCDARARLPLEVCVEAAKGLGALASGSCGLIRNGLRVLLVDGTTLQTPRTRENSAGFGHSRNGKRTSHLPLVRMLVLMCAGSAAMVDAVLGGYGCSEMFLFREMLERLSPENLLVADSGFSSYLALWLVRERKCQMLARHHQSRVGKVVKVLGDGDELHEWTRPKKEWVIWKDLLARTPPVLMVRVITATVVRKGYRDLELKLCTTLLDADRHPAADLIVLYMQRWHVELDLRTLKCGYGLKRLSGKTPDIIRKEIYTTLIAYNAVCQVLALSGKSARLLSATRAKAQLQECCAQMSRAPVQHLPGMFKKLLRQVGEMSVQFQDRPPEPRALVGTRSEFPRLKIPRARWRSKLRLG